MVKISFIFAFAVSQLFMIGMIATILILPVISIAAIVSISLFA